LANPKFISLHQELTPILTPELNVGTNIIDHIYIKRYKKYLYYHWWAHNVPGHSRVEKNARIAKIKIFPQIDFQRRYYIPTTYTKTQDVTI